MSTPPDRLEQRIFLVVPFALLVVSATVVAVLDGPDPVQLATVAATAAWLGVRERVPSVAHFPVLLGFGAALVAQSPMYGFYAWSNYLVAAELPRAWLPAGIVAAAFVMAGSQAGGFPGDWPIYLVIVLVNVGVAGAMVLLAVRQHEQRMRLEAALRENAGLHAQLIEQAREAGVLDERARMAREIHDTIAQGLAGIVTQLEAAEQSGDHAHVAAAERLARESLTEARRSVQALRPAALETARLPEALTQVTGSWSRLHEVPAEVVTTGDPRPLPVDVEATLLRTAQEALANVAKHARASRVGLTLSYMDDQVTLDVRDDGVGGAQQRAGGFGLASMLERVERQHGRLAIESEPGAGTAVSASVPA